MLEIFQKFKGPKIEFNYKKLPVRSLRSVVRFANNARSAKQKIETNASSCENHFANKSFPDQCLKRSKKCSICGISGHDSRTRPEKQKTEMELNSAQKIFQCSVPVDVYLNCAENSNSADLQILPVLTFLPLLKIIIFVVHSAEKLLQIQEMVENFCFALIVELLRLLDLRFRFQ
ncbi:hypothetical protein P9112_010042 [Eukaryota sp. TZLM1-RC]